MQEMRHPPGSAREVFRQATQRCRKCGGGLEKLFSPPAIQFKGEGWYVTDYARKGSVAEKVEKELSSSDSSADKPASGDKDKSKKTPAKKSDKS
jgi:predicted nucleic acid-binding Zn ribbon protein